MLVLLLEACEGLEAPPRRPDGGLEACDGEAPRVCLCGPFKVGEQACDVMLRRWAACVCPDQ